MTDPRATDASPWRDNERVFGMILTSIFLAIAIFNVLHHAMWRDETRAWQIVLASPNFAALRQNLRFEGVPMLWYLILWPLAKITSNPIAMQLVHVVIAAGVVFTFAIAAPFGRVMKTLFAFGYFPYFEYATISRNYGLVFLLLLMGVAIGWGEKHRPIWFGVVLALLAQVSIWGCGFASLLVVVWIVEKTCRLKPARQRAFGVREILAIGLVIVSCVLAYFESIPGPGASYIITWLPGATGWEKFMGSIGTIWKGWMPVPILWQRVWWNTNVLDDYYATHFVCASVLLLVAILCLLRRPIALVFLVVGLGAPIAFTYFKFCGFTRHHGQLFMVLVAACWMATRSREWSPRWKRIDVPTKWLDARRNFFFGSLLVIHAILGVSANIADNMMPFSAGKAVAEYLRHDVPANVTLVGVDDYCMSPISTYLHREFYFPQEGKFAPFNTQDDRQRTDVTPQSTFEDIRKLIAHDGRDVIFLRSQAMVIGPAQFDLTFPATGDLPKMVIQVTLLKQFVDSTVPDEMESVYLFHRVD